MAQFYALQLSKFSALSKDEFVNLARVAETAERYEDMALFVKQFVEAGDAELDEEQRNLLSVAYKNVIGTRRAALRTMVPEEGKKGIDNPNVLKHATILENEIKVISDEILELLKSKLLPNAGSDESKVFFLKMAGDYNRYVSEFAEDDSSAKGAEKKYSEALELAKSSLPATHPIRLGLALNFSVCYYEILKDQKAACQLAKEAFDDAISKLDQLDESSYKDSTLIMQLLRDNLTLWTSDSQEE